MSARVLLGATELHRRVALLGQEVAAAGGDGTVVVAVLDGSLVFVADLVRAMASEVTIDFLALSSYGRGSGRVRLVKDLDVDVGGR
ncbi:MAG: hypoxanthine phosphoribosyltransferase, partial [Actinomycetota bacterium]|nr:hypoxanthine phosphoribosyltransferase [Actinomycetota bacterium]